MVAFHDWQRRTARPVLAEAAEDFPEATTSDDQERSTITVATGGERWSLCFRADAETRKVQVFTIAHHDPEHALQAERRFPPTFDLDQLDGAELLHRAAAFLG
jgi:hypothetical protein